MALRNVVGSGLSCSGCRVSLVRSFLAAGGIETLPIRERPRWQIQRNLQQTSPFTQGRRFLSREDVESDLEKKIAVEEDPVADQDTTVTPPALSNEASVPWYLQDTTTFAPQDHPLSERQRLPELPENPPPFLQPLLEHISVELGLDDLSLLDLRSLDPPPALGGNLVMIIGTARSEKHLHVSADRLCRWLRTTHSLSPFADGLLGRNELKLKMRRKAKRSRMLSSVGAKETGRGDVDDGIRTGWVCVNVGKVEGGVLEKKEEPKKQGEFVGFGTQTDGTRIVVQMMTDEKRGQIDLETLWNGILRRAKKREEAEKQEDEEAESRIENGHLIEGQVQERRPGSASTYSSPRASSHLSSGPRQQQARAYHTQRTLQARQMQSTNASSGPDAYLEMAERHTKAHRTLSALLNLLKKADQPLALEALGESSEDQSSTSFLAAFHNEIPSFPDHIFWEKHIQLRCYAVKIGHPGYRPECLLSALEDMEEACVDLSESHVQPVLQVLLDPTVFAGSRSQTASGASIAEIALAVMDKTEEHGLHMSMKDVYQQLYLATNPNAGLEPPVSSLLSQNETAGVRFSGVSALTLYRLRTAIASQAWNEVWALWSSHPKRFASRFANYYVCMLGEIAKTGNRHQAIKALRTCVPTMYIEEPRINIHSDVAEAVLCCLKVAEPKAEEMGRRGGKSEWAVLWRKAHNGLHGLARAVNEPTSIKGTRSILLDHAIVQ